MSFMIRLKQAREKKCLTQKELADMVGVSKSAIANYETGVSVAKTEVLLKLFKALNIDANFLFQDELPHDVVYRMNDGFVFGELAELLDMFDKLDTVDQEQLLSYGRFLSAAEKYIDKDQLSLLD